MLFHVYIHILCFVSVCEEGNQWAWRNLPELCSCFLFIFSWGFEHFLNWFVKAFYWWLYFYHNILNNQRKASGLNYKHLFLLYEPADGMQKLCLGLTRHRSVPHLSFWDQWRFWACLYPRQMARAQEAKPNYANIFEAPVAFFWFCFLIFTFHWPKQVR